MIHLSIGNSPFISRVKAFTGKKRDALGREQCYQTGQHVSCATRVPTPVNPKLKTTAAKAPDQTESAKPSQEQADASYEEALEVLDNIGASVKGKPKLRLMSVADLQRVEDHEETESGKEYMERMYRAGAPVMPPVVDQDGLLVDGHHRYEGAKRAGLSKIWVLVVHIREE